MTLEEVIRMAMHYFDQSKSQSKIHQTWKGNVKDKYDQKKKGYKPPYLENHQVSDPEV